MNVEIKAEAPQFPEKEYINGIAVAVWVNLVGKVRECFPISCGTKENRVSVHTFFLRLMMTCR
jgi:hypothetical protein